MHYKINTMMKKSIFIVFALAAFMAVGCKDDSPAEPLEKNPNVSRGSDIKPTAWIAPDPSLYEITMSIQVELGNKLANYQSEEDLMRAVINGETHRPYFASVMLCMASQQIQTAR